MKGAARGRKVPTIRLSDVRRIVASRPALVSSLITASVVGTLLSLINQGSVIIGGHGTAATWIRVLLNYLIPFIVSNISFVAATLNAADRRGTREADPSR
jgi:hypothetical protein